MKRTPLLIAIVVSLVWMISFSLRAVSGDEHWDNQFGWPGPGGNISAIATHNGQVYVSGPASSTNVAIQRWDGWQWSPFAQFYGGSSGTTIYDLAFVGDTLYAAGYFTNVNGIAANGLAKWDGASWSSVNNFAGTVIGLTVDGANLYVCGAFTNPAAGGVMATNIAYWDGAAWHALGNGLGSVGTSSARAAAIKNGLVYVVGVFTNSGPQLITNVAVWDGNTWSMPGGGVSGLGVYALTFNGNDLYVAGAFSQAGSTAANLVARWDGTNCSALGAGLSGSIVYSVAAFKGSVYVTGTFTTAGGILATNVAVWNGSVWAPLGVGISTYGLRVYSTATNVLLGGNFLLAGGIVANGLGAWDGTKWDVIGTPGRINGVSTTVRAIAGQSTNLYIGGSFSSAGQTNARLVAHFDGQKWSPMGSGVSGGNNLVVNVMTATSSNVYVGGSFTTAGGVGSANIAAWDGTNWSAFGSGPGGVVAAIAVRPDGIYAAGAPQGASLYGAPFFMRWDGATWQSAVAFDPNDTFFAVHLNDPNIGMDAVAFQDTNIYVGGHFSITWHDPNDINIATNCLNIMRVDSAGYARIVGTGFNSNVVALAVLGTNLYAAGLFTNAGGVAANRLARWDGNVWSDVGGSVVGNGTVNTLTIVGTNLYAGGTFTNMGGVPASRVARWDGNAWYALGSGVSATVGVLSSSGSDLFAGGSFRIAGGKPSLFLGRWNAQMNLNTPQLSNALWLGPGQFRARVYGVGGATNLVEATTDFSTWTPVSTNSAGIYDFVDPTAGNFPRRFYRVRLSP